MGCTSGIRISQRREDLSIISSLTTRGKVRLKAFEGAILIDFMKRLIGDAPKDSAGKVSLALDNLRVYHTKLVQA